MPPSLDAPSAQALHQRHKPLFHLTICRLKPFGARFGTVQRIGKARAIVGEAHQIVLTFSHPRDSLSVLLSRRRQP